MKNYLLSILKYSMLFAFVLSFSSAIAQTSTTTTLSREELALKKAEDKVEATRIKLVTVKKQIDTADSLYVAGEKLSDDSKIAKAEARDEVKAIEKQYKSDSKPYNKAMKSKDRSEAAEARAELKPITTQYKLDLKAAQNKVKAADKGLINADRMMDKADKKLDSLSKKLKTYEKVYEDAEEALNDKKEGK